MGLIPISVLLITICQCGLIFNKVQVLSGRLVRQELCKITLVSKYHQKDQGLITNKSVKEG